MRRVIEIAPHICLNYSIYNKISITPYIWLNYRKKAAAARIAAAASLINLFLIISLPCQREVARAA